MTQIHQPIFQSTIQSTSKMHANDSLDAKTKKQKQPLISYNAQKKGDNCEANREIVNIFCSLLKRIVQQNNEQNPVSSAFDLKGEARMDLEPFIKSTYFLTVGIQSHFKCSETCFIFSIILINRLQSQNPEIYLHKKNIHKLFVTALLIAVKYCDDDSFKNSYYATIAGIENKELNMLELEFLSMIRFEVYVEESVLREYSNKIMGYGKRRA